MSESHSVMKESVHLVPERPPYTVAEPTTTNKRTHDGTGNTTSLCIAVVVLNIAPTDLTSVCGVHQGAVRPMPPTAAGSVRKELSSSGTVGVTVQASTVDVPDDEPPVAARHMAGSELLVTHVADVPAVEALNAATAHIRVAAIADDYLVDPVVDAALLTPVAARGVAAHVELDFVG
jgi:hypothetical protein